MKKIQIFNYLGKPIKADLIFAFSCPENEKNYIALNNGDLVFSENSSYNNLDILEIVSEENNEYIVTTILDDDWEIVQKTMIDEIFSKIKSEF